MLSEATHAQLHMSRIKKMLTNNEKVGVTNTMFPVHVNKHVHYENALFTTRRPSEVSKLLASSMIHAKFICLLDSILKLMCL